MADLGFIIPLNENDYLSFIGKPQGDRKLVYFPSAPRRKRSLLDK